MSAFASWVALAAGIIGAFGYPAYLRDILANRPILGAKFIKLQQKGKLWQFFAATPSKPDPIAWANWLIEYVVLFTAMYISIGPNCALWLPGLQLIGVAATALATFTCSDRTPKQLLRSLSKNDALTFFGTLAAMALWPLANALTAIVILLVVEAISAGRTALNAFKSPSNEPLTFWWFVFAGGTIGATGVWMAPGSAILDYVYAIAIALLALQVIVMGRLGASPRFATA